MMLAEGVGEAGAEGLPNSFPIEPRIANQSALAAIAKPASPGARIQNRSFVGL